MTKIRSSPTRNVENIRQKNVEDNHLFLEKLLMSDIRKDFLSSARSILRKDGSDQIKKYTYHTYQKVDRTTRYNEKVKSGKIGPFIPEWQRLLDEKKKEIEKKSLEKERRKLEIEQRKQEYQRKKEELQLEKERKRQEAERKKEELQLERERKRQETERKREEYKRKREEILLDRELRKIEREFKREEANRIRLARQRPPKPSIWADFAKNNPHPYQRSFIPRRTKVGERAEQNSF